MRTKMRSTKRTHKQLIELRKRCKSYSDAWSEIKKHYLPYECIRQHGSKRMQNTYAAFIVDVPLLQEYLTESNSVCTSKIIYNCYTAQSVDDLMSKNIYIAFHGILEYIHFYSSNTYNTTEIEVHFPLSNIMYTATTFAATHPKYAINNTQHNILNIFTYNDATTSFTVPISDNAYFGVLFKRVGVQPVCYAIRSPVCSPYAASRCRLVSWVFEAYDLAHNKWVLLDERCNQNDLIPDGAWNVFFTRHTEQYFSAFRVRQTEPSSNGFWGFTMAAFEIHGCVEYISNLANNAAAADDVVDENNNVLLNDDEKKSIFDDDVDYNMDMSDFLM